MEYPAVIGFMVALTAESVASGRFHNSTKIVIGAVLAVAVWLIYNKDINDFLLNVKIK